MTEPFYVAVKASLHASDSSVFGLTPEEVIALSKRYPDSNREVINGVLIKASPLKVINSLCELGYRVVCSSGEAEIVWTLRREVLVKNGLSQKSEENVIQKIDSQETLAILPSNVKTEVSDNMKLTRKEKEFKLGTKPEDFNEFSDYGGPTIHVRNPSSLHNIDEDAKIIVNTNVDSPENPLRIGTSDHTNKPRYNDHTFSEMDDHSHTPLIPSVHQTLDEMDFERGIWPAAMTGEINLLRRHLNKGKDVDIEDNAGYTALHYAARNGHKEICAMLLKAGASVNKPTRAGRSTALHRAAMLGHLETCAILLQNGADPFLKDIDERTPLHRAVETGKYWVIRFLLDLNPELAYTPDSAGRTPIDYAEGSNETISSLFNKSHQQLK